MCFCEKWYRNSLTINPTGYKDEVIHESLLQVFHNGVFADLGQQHHVVHTALLDILTLPVVLTALQESTVRVRECTSFYLELRQRKAEVGL